MPKKKTRSAFSAITDWPEHERPRERLLKYGADALSDAELLAILLRTGTANHTAVDIARALLEKSESLERLSSRGISDLRHLGKNLGVGLAKAATIAAAFEIGRRAAAAHHRRRKERINSPEDIAQRYIPAMRDKRQETFHVILLDSANHIIRDVKISEGILNSSLVHPREVFKPAIVEPAASIILLHNHPSGNPEPSSEDVQITRQLVEASKVIGIPVHDHIIIAGNSYTSFAERGIL